MIGSDHRSTRLRNGSGVPQFKNMYTYLSNNAKLSVFAGSLILLCIGFFFHFSGTSRGSLRTQLEIQVRPYGKGDSGYLPNRTRVVCFGDTHGKHEAIVVPEADVLVYTGDCTNPGSNVSNEQQIKRFNNWLGTLPHKHKFVVAGNHDPEQGVSLTDLRKLFTNAHYLQDESIRIFLPRSGQTLIIYGSPWQPQFEGFLTYRKPGPGNGGIKDLWENSIPESVDIVATHSPPEGFLDAGVGSHDLLEILKKVQPKLNCFGHIHKGRREKMSGVQRIHHGSTLYVNGAIVNDDLEPLWDPVLVEIP